MPIVVIETTTHAAVELCFDLAHNVTAHAESAAFSERIVEPGRTEGLLECGDLVAFEGRHLGIRQRFVSRITELDRPNRFVDEIIHGALSDSGTFTSSNGSGTSHWCVTSSSGKRPLD